MHFADFNLHAIAIRHLIAVYVVVLGVQGSYFAWILTGWLKLDGKKATKPV